MALGMAFLKVSDSESGITNSGDMIVELDLPIKNKIKSIGGKCFNIHECLHYLSRENRIVLIFRPSSRFFRLTILI